jgi:flagellar protein FliL
MSEAPEPAGGTAPGKRKRGRLLIVALPLALLGGGAAFFAVFSGLVPPAFLGSGETASGTAGGDGAAPLEREAGAARSPGFVAMAPLVISLGPEARARHLKIALAIEVDPERAAEVEAIRPRIADVLNTFLRAVDAGVLERPRSMARLRAQMLRRVQLVTAPGAVRDVLIEEFVLN